MQRLSFLFLLFILVIANSCTQHGYTPKTATDSNGLEYEYITGDPLQTRIYTLDNGLKVYMSDNKNEPRVYTLIAVNAGSTDDPEETTGLAHYFEHMMFKGTDDIATLNWEEERVLLEKIEALFEEHKKEKDPEKAAAIYATIDSLSYLAAGYAVPNEYDKLVASIGASGTNAGTSFDQTVYINDIPANEIEKWISLEYERFNDMVLRLFHTELETVYEEFNMYQDQDNSRAFFDMLEAMFPEHPYGRAIIGLPEHLKRPSITNIYEFAEQYYVPSNMAIALAGDLDFDETIRMINETFGQMEPGNPPVKERPDEEPITEPVELTVTGPTSARVMFSYRFDGAGSEEEKYVTLIDMILSNSRAGLIDLNLVQEQKVINAGCSPFFLRDYGIHQFYGSPREGQSLQEVRDLLLEQVELIKNGEFEEWMLDAVINNLKLNTLRGQESNASRANTFVESFITGVPYSEKLVFLDELEQVTKEDLMTFAQEHYQDNYVIVYKESGENDELVKVEKPEITALQLNRDAQSDYYLEFISRETEAMEPMFVDFGEAIETSETSNGLRFDYVHNPLNETFTLWYILDMGKDHMKLLPHAVNYLSYLGTDRYTASELRQEFYKLGINTGVSTSANRSYIYISGLEDNLEAGIELFEHLLSSVVPDEEAYANYVDGVLKKREDAKKDQNTILWNAMLDFAYFGENSPFNTLMTEEELRSLDPSVLTDLLKGMYDYEHKVYYYGNMEAGEAREIIEKYHSIPGELKEIPEPVEYTQKSNDQHRVYLVDYDMVQANLLMVSNDGPMTLEIQPEATLFNDYFGFKMSSIVFQEIRESRGLAYSAAAIYSIPARTDRNNFLIGFLGTQADKLPEALSQMMQLFTDMPRAEKQFDLARQAIIKQIQTERITNRGIYGAWMTNQDRGVDYDTRKDVYQAMQSVTMDDLDAFFENHVAGKKFDILVLGDLETLDRNALAEYGPVEVLKLEELFGY